MFQSTRPRGARLFLRIHYHMMQWFQSTRPRGARRRNGIVYGAGENCFNPRARVGRDIDACLIFPMSGVFQSTRPRGARRFLLQRRYILAGSFNPRARVGRDPGIDCSGIKVIGFQSTRPRGARQRWLHSWQVPPQFQSTRPRGARRQTLAFGKVASAVSIHAPAWGATFRYVFPLCNLGQFQSTRPRGARPPHHNSLRDKDFFRVIREPLLPLDPKGTGQVAATQKANEISMLLKCEPSRESRTA